MSCYEEAIDGCSLLRKEYGRLFRKFKALPMIQKIKKSLLAINGPDGKSAIIEPCASPKNVANEVKSIAAKCPISKSRTQPVQNIVEYCVIMQNHIDCALAEDTDCPMAVTDFLAPIMSSLGLVHSIFCSNITMYGLSINSVNTDCTGDTYREVYKNCWQNYMTDLAIANGDVKHEISPGSTITFLNWNIHNDTSLCRSFKDTERYNFTKLTTCAAQLDRQCPLPFPVLAPSSNTLPTHFDATLYNIIETGLMPFNEYGAWFLQMKRDDLCYEECQNYTALDTLYSTDCKNNLRNLSNNLSSTPTEAQCKTFADSLACVSNFTARCPLFQYQTRELVMEAKISAAITACSLPAPEILPDDYYLITTTIPPPTTTTYWRASSVETQTVADNSTTTNSATYAVYIMLLLFRLALLS